MGFLDRLGRVQRTRQRRDHPGRYADQLRWRSRQRLRGPAPAGRLVRSGDADWPGHCLGSAIAQKQSSYYGVNELKNELSLTVPFSSLKGLPTIKSGRGLETGSD